MFLFQEIEYTLSKQHKNPALGTIIIKRKEVTGLN